MWRTFYDSLSLYEQEEDKLKRPFDERCEKLILTLFGEARRCAEGKTHTAVFKVTKHGAFKAFFTREASPLLNSESDRFGKSQIFVHGRVRELVKSSTYTVLVARFLLHQGKRDVTCDAIFRQHMSREVVQKETFMSLSPLTGRSPESSKTSNNNKQKLEK